MERGGSKFNEKPGQNSVEINSEAVPGFICDGSLSSRSVLRVDCPREFFRKTSSSFSVATDLYWNPYSAASPEKLSTGGSIKKAVV